LTRDNCEVTHVKEIQKKSEIDMWR